jgi:hypothetical protein
VDDKMPAFFAGQKEIKAYSLELRREQSSVSMIRIASGPSAVMAGEVAFATSYPEVGVWTMTCPRLVHLKLAQQPGPTGLYYL